MTKKRKKRLLKLFSRNTKRRTNMMTTTAKNRFLEACEKVLNAKPKKGVRLNKTAYVGNYKGEVMTITIERGDKLNRIPSESFYDRRRGLSA